MATTTATPHPEIPTPKWALVNLNDALTPGHPEYDMSDDSMDDESYITRHEEAAQAERTRLAGILQQQTRNSTPKREGISGNATPSTPKRVRDKVLHAQFPGPLESWRLMEEVKSRLFQSNDQMSERALSIAERRRALANFAQPLQSLVTLHSVLTNETTKLRGMVDKLRLMETDVTKAVSTNAARAPPNGNADSPAHKKMRPDPDAFAPGEGLKIAMEQTALSQAESAKRVFVEQSRPMLSAFTQLLAQAEWPVSSPVTFAGIQAAFDQATAAPMGRCPHGDTRTGVTELVRKNLDADMYPGVSASFMLKEGYLLDGYTVPHGRRRRKRKRASTAVDARVDEGKLTGFGFVLDKTVLGAMGNHGVDRASGAGPSTPRQVPPSGSLPALSKNASARLQRIYPALVPCQPSRVRAEQTAIPDLQLNMPAELPQPPAPPRVEQPSVPDLQLNIPAQMPPSPSPDAANVDVSVDFVLESGVSTPSPSTPSTIRNMRPEDAIHELDRHHQHPDVRSFLDRFPGAVAEDSGPVGDTGDDECATDKAPKGGAEAPETSEKQSGQDLEIGRVVQHAEENREPEEEKGTAAGSEGSEAKAGDDYDPKPEANDTTQAPINASEDAVAGRANGIVDAAVSRKNDVAFGTSSQLTPGGAQEDGNPAPDQPPASSTTDLPASEIRSDGGRAEETTSKPPEKPSIRASADEIAPQPTPVTETMSAQPTNQTEHATAPDVPLGESDDKGEPRAPGSTPGTVPAAVAGYKSSSHTPTSDSAVVSPDDGSIFVHDSSESVVPSSSGGNEAGHEGKRVAAKDEKKEVQMASSTSASGSVKKADARSEFIVLD